MRTQLPQAIGTLDEAKAFLSELIKNREHYHPEDDAHDIEWEDARVSFEECEQLNKLMEDIYSLPESWDSETNPGGFDPCGYILDNDPFYQALMEEE